MDDESNKRKPHRAKKSGRKAEKKAKKNEGTKEVSQAGMTAKQRNPKGFAIQNVAKLRKKVLRTLDIKEKKIHDPVVDRTPLEPPPIIIAVVGPPKVGKSTLMRGLIKNYTSQKLSDIKGPVTVVSGKKRRLTFIECNNDMNSMIDIAKVADLVLLLIDASFGMEMETFEFLNICQVHGFPRIMGVLTHLDYFKNDKKLKTVRKTLKHRFWTEIYQGAKLFYLSGMVYGEYLKNEMQNLARFISVMKFRPLTWRNSHPYVLADRMEDITDPETLRLDSKANRTVSFYGWMRGVPLKNKSTIHIPGCGDFQVADVSHLPDPCPLPDLTKRRSLNEVERKIYAPFSGVGGVVYDKDAVYIDMADNQQNNQQNQDDSEDESGDLKAAMIGSQKTIDEKMTESALSIFSNSKAITSEQFTKQISMPECESVEDSGRTRRKAVFKAALPKTGDNTDVDDSGDEMSDDDEIDMSRVVPLDQKSAALHTVKEDGDNDEEADSEEEEEDEEEGGNGEEEEEESDDEAEEDDNTNIGQLRWKENLVAKASQAFLNRQRSTPNLRKLVYELDSNKAEEKKDSTDDVGGLFKVVSKSQKNRIDGNDTTRMLLSAARDWDDEEVKSLIKDCFVTGSWEASKDAQKLLDQDDELYGDFEDLEKAAAGSDDDGDVESDDGSEMSAESEEDNSEDEDKPGADKSEGEGEEEEEPLDGNTQRSKKLSKEERKAKTEEKRQAKKARIKEMFDQEYDKATRGDGAESLFDSRKAELDAQARLNRSEFEGMEDDLRVLYEGYRAGLYVRIEIKDMPCEFVTNFDPKCPVIIGGMTSSETVVGMLQARFKKHRWYAKILKTKDPLIFSLGWRRFQSIPLYTVQDHNGRNRHLKYTPEHMHCNAIFWGPSTPQNTGLMCLQSYSNDQKGFRVCATGVILQQDKSIAVMKKLKLIGYPYKVHRKTAFIKDMFTSQLEIAKFEGAKIKTVSGIRGQVKKALRAPEGAFRATFEDSILNSDVIFLKTWYQVEIPQFYNPVTNMLLKTDDRAEWQGMKTLGMLRKEKGVKAPFSKDSQYQKEAVRKQHNLKPLVIPRKLQKDLPFDFKPKKRTEKFIDPVLSKRVAIVRDSHEKKRDQLLNQMRMIHTAQDIKNREDKQKRHNDFVKKRKVEDAEREQRQKKVKKEIFTKLGKVKESQGKKMSYYEPQK